MTTTPADKPGEIDLDKVEKNRFDRGGIGVVDAEALIAAVVALRERVTELEGDLKHSEDKLWSSAGRNNNLAKELAAAEARVAELAGALEVVWHLIEGAEFDDINDDDDLVVVTIQAPQARHIRTVLAVTPAEALERAKAVENCIAALRFYARHEVSQVVTDALDRLDALGSVIAPEEE